MEGLRGPASLGMLTADPFLHTAVTCDWVEALPLRHLLIAGGSRFRHQSEQTFGSPWGVQTAESLPSSAEAEPALVWCWARAPLGPGPGSFCAHPRFSSSCLLCSPSHLPPVSSAPISPVAERTSPSFEWAGLSSGDQPGVLWCQRDSVCPCGSAQPPTNHPQGLQGVTSAASEVKGWMGSQAVAGKCGKVPRAAGGCEWVGDPTGVATIVPSCCSVALPGRNL